MVKRAIAGQHHHYTVEHAAMYIDEAAYKYNTGKWETPWDDFMARAVGVASSIRHKLYSKQWRANARYRAYEAAAT